MTEKRKYEKPSQEVIKLQHDTMLLAGSGTEATRAEYGEPTEWNWE